MPDIELYGAIEKAAVIDVLHGCSYGEQLTIVRGPLDVQPDPFVRVSATHQFKYMKDLIGRLRRLKCDLEIMKIETFYPKGELR